MTRDKAQTRRHHDSVHPRHFNTLVDNLVFALSGLSALWLAWLVLSESLSVGWYMVPFFILFWLILAYLVLPRLHSILTALYVPDYFIGRARTSDGLLGDPVNLAAEGSEAQLHAAMLNAGWIRADEVTLRSSLRIITSTLLRRSYDEAPVSPLLLFGRQQDMAYQQEVAGNPAKRHHARFWKCPDGWLLPGGHKADWMAAGTFDKAVGFSLFTLQITHKIAANTDVERDHIVQTVLKGNPEASVRTIQDFSTGYHSRNGGGDSIQTDGNLPVLDMRKVAPAATLPGGDAATRLDARQRRRPIAINLGVLLMAVRVVVGIVTIAMMFAGRNSLATELTTSLAGYGGGDEAGVALMLLNVLAIATSVAFAAYLGLAVFVHQGRNWARVAAMAFSVVSIIVYAITFFNGENVSLRKDLFGLPVDILVLLALSAQSASLWSRRLRMQGKQ